MSTEDINATSTAWPEFIELVQPGVIVKLENRRAHALYKFASVAPDKTIVCKVVHDVIAAGCEVGALVNVIRPTSDGSCVMPASISLIKDNGRCLTLIPMGRPIKVQRRVFPRVAADGGINLKLEFDNGNSRYKSMQVHDISGGGIGLTIYSKNSIYIGQRAKLEIEFHTHRNKVAAHGEVVQCSQRNEMSREFRIGIMFSQISEEDQTVVLEFVAAETQRQMMAGKLEEKRVDEAAKAHVGQAECPSQVVDQVIPVFPVGEESSSAVAEDASKRDEQQPDELSQAV